MPVESKVGLVLGVIITMALAICFHSKETPVPGAAQVSPESNRQVPVQGQSTSLRK